MQPVFEQGSALLIPSDEIIIGFRETLSLAEAEEAIASHKQSQGIIEVRQARPGPFVLKINNAGDGRCYRVSQVLTGLDSIAYAEPNHIVVRQTERF